MAGLAVGPERFEGAWFLGSSPTARAKSCVLRAVAAGTAGSGDEAHGLSVTAIEEGNSDPLATIAADLKPIGAPAAVWLIDSDPALMALFLASGVALQEQPVATHDTPDPFVVWRRRVSRGRGGAPQNGVDAADSRVSTSR